MPQVNRAEPGGGFFICKDVTPANWEAELAHRRHSPRTAIESLDFLHEEPSESQTKRRQG